MKFTTVNASKAPALALTSMLDVIFLLLCFFVTVSVYSQWESEISIKLPSANSAEEPERFPGTIVVNLDRTGHIRVNGEEWTHEKLQTSLKRISKFYPGQPVIIRADKETKYDDLVKVIDACRAGDVWNFSLATEGSSTK